MRRTLPRRLGRPQKNMYFDQNGSFFKLVTLRVRAQPAPGQSCILNSGLVTTKNRCPSPEAGLSCLLREGTRPERGSRPRPWPRRLLQRPAPELAAGHPSCLSARDHLPVGSAEPRRDGLRRPGAARGGDRAAARQGLSAVHSRSMPGGRWTLAGPGCRAAPSEERPPRGRPGPTLAVGIAKMADAAVSNRRKHTGVAVRSCVYFAERAAFRCPGSQCSRGTWKFLWIKHGAEARWAVWVGSAPSPPRSSSAAPTHPRHPFIPLLLGPSSTPAQGPPPSLTPVAQSRGASTPSPSLEEAAGQGRAGWEGLVSNGGPSDLQIFIHEMGANVQTRQDLRDQNPENAQDTVSVTGPALRKVRGTREL